MEQADNNNYLDQLDQAVAFIREQYTATPPIGLILGSGLGALAAEISSALELPYTQIPHFPVATVQGHAGQLVLGQLGGKQVAVLQGRFHYYEGYPLTKVVFPTRVLGQLGIKVLIVTNAAGGVDGNFTPGDLMLITDHINLLGDNPLIGPNWERLGPRFPDMSEAYSRRLIRLADQEAKKMGLQMQKGVYLATSGPSYETPAEIRMMRALGASAIGMSTVPEVIVARHMGIEVLGISCITNMAAGMQTQGFLSHSEVIETTERVKEKFAALLKQIISRITAI